MSSVREHLKNFHEASGAHHVRMAKLHRAAMQKADVDSDDEAFHESASAAHTERAAYHTGCAKDLSAAMKAAGIGDGDDALVPTRVSSVHPDAPARGGRAVPRAGQREISLDATKVDLALETFVKVDDE